LRVVWDLPGETVGRDLFADSVLLPTSLERRWMSERNIWNTIMQATDRSRRGTWKSYTCQSRDNNRNLLASQHQKRVSRRIDSFHFSCNHQAGSVRPKTHPVYDNIVLQATWFRPHQTAVGDRHWNALNLDSVWSSLYRSGMLYTS